MTSDADAAVVGSAISKFKQDPGMLCARFTGRMTRYERGRRRVGGRDVEIH